MTGADLEQQTNTSLVELIKPESETSAFPEHLADLRELALKEKTFLESEPGELIVSDKPTTLEEQQEATKDAFLDVGVSEEQFEEMSEGSLAERRKLFGKIQDVLGKLRDKWGAEDYRQFVFPKNWEGVQSFEVEPKMLEQNRGNHIVLGGNERFEPMVVVDVNHVLGSTFTQIEDGLERLEQSGEDTSVTIQLGELEKTYTLSGEIANLSEEEQKNIAYAIRMDFATQYEEFQTTYFSGSGFSPEDMLSNRIAAEAIRAGKDPSAEGIAEYMNETFGGTKGQFGKIESAFMTVLGQTNEDPNSAMTIGELHMIDGKTYLDVTIKELPPELVRDFGELNSRLGSYWSVD